MLINSVFKLGLSRCELAMIFGFKGSARPRRVPLILIEAIVEGPLSRIPKCFTLIDEESFDEFPLKDERPALCEIRGHDIPAIARQVVNY